MRIVVALWLLACVGICAQEYPQTGDLPGQPFYIKKTWQIGGGGNWDQMVLDPAAQRLFIAHTHAVQVVDVSSGGIAGEIKGFGNAHGIALDDSGQMGYIADGPANQVKVFDRATLKVVASIATSPSPRALVLEPQSGLLFAVSATPLGPATQDKSHAPQVNVRSPITLIDVQKREAIATLVLPGRPGFAVADTHGQVYVVLGDHIARIDAQQVLAAAHDAPARAGQAGAQVMLYWDQRPRPADGRVRTFNLAPECHNPGGLAVDSAHDRIFAACGNMNMLVVNGMTGEHVAALSIGPGAEAIGYDAARGLIFTANGGAQGSVSIIRQDVTDTYAVIANLTTRQQARSLAVNSSTGEVYVVAEVVDPARWIGILHPTAVQGTFEVLVIGN
jgi:DNA-binding beta-propeller fold protein YncE